MSETAHYMDNGSYEVNSTYTTVILDMTRSVGNASNASDGVIVGPSGGNPISGTGDLAGQGTGRIIIALAGSSMPIVLPATWIPDIDSQEGTRILTTEHAVQINGNQPLAYDGLAVSSWDDSLLNDSLGSDLVVQSKLLVIEPGADYMANGSTKGYNNEIRQGQESTGFERCRRGADRAKGGCQVEEFGR